MSIEFYHDLLLAQSLEYKMKEHLSVIDEQNKRLQFMAKQIETRQDEANIAKQSLMEMQAQVRKCEAKHQQQAERIKRLRVDSDSCDAKQLPTLEREIQSATLEYAQAEAALYTLMEQEESLVADCLAAEQFLPGARKTLETIRIEVQAIKLAQENALKELEDRVKIVLAQTPVHFQRAYKEANQKHKFKSPTTYLDRINCQTCGYEHDRATIQEVETGNSLHHCHGCGRLLIPLNAKS